MGDRKIDALVAVVLIDKAGVDAFLILSVKR